MIRITQSKIRIKAAAQAGFSAFVGRIGSPKWKQTSPLVACVDPAYDMAPSSHQISVSKQTSDDAERSTIRI